jgi:tetratricopeptide (TPR) repeat protein
LFTLAAQPDSLQLLLKSSKDKIVTIEICQQLGDYWKSRQSDSARKYYQLALGEIGNLPNETATWQLSGELHISMATFCIDLGLIDEGWFHDSLAIDSGKKTGASKILAQANNIKGVIYYNTGYYDSAIFYYRKSLRLATSINDKKLTSKIYTNLGIIKFLQGDADSAQICFEKPLQIATKTGDNALLAGSYHNIGLLNYYMGHMQTAEDYYLQSKNLYEKMNDYQGLILSLNSLGNIYHAKAQYNKALNNYKQIVKINMLIGDKLNLAKAYHNMAEVYVQIGDELNAMNNYLISIEIKEELDDKKGIGASYVGLGILNSNKGNSPEALLYYKKALALYQSLEYQMGIGTVTGTIASAFISLQQADSAVKYYEKAIGIFKKLEMPQGLSDNYMSLAIALEAQAGYELVMDYYNKAIKLKIEIEDNENLGMAYYHLAKYHNSLADSANPEKRGLLYAKALDYGQQAYDISREYDIIPLQNYASTELKNTYKALGNPAKALYYAEIQNQTSDSLFRLSKTEAATFAEVRWQSQRKQQEIEKLNKDKELQAQIMAKRTAESRQKNIIIFSLIAFLIALGIIVILIYFYRKKHEALNHQLQLNKMSRLRFENMRNRLSPHFLFNVLGSITPSLEDKPEIKNKIIAITRMLRQSLENVEKSQISIEDEINFMKDYIEMQQNNYSKNVNIHWDVDSKLLQCKIPMMALQTPVENALKHGLMPFEGEKNLCISIEKYDGSVLMIVEDNGIGRKNSKGRTAGTGTGLKVLLQTIRLLNEKNNQQIIFNIEDKEPQGTKVEIRVPVEFDYNF